jgi:hypothetical protein
MWMWAAVQFDDDIDIDDKEECGSVPMTVEKVNLCFGELAQSIFHIASHD